MPAVITRGTPSKITTSSLIMVQKEESKETPLQNLQRTRMKGSVKIKTQEE